MELTPIHSLIEPGWWQHVPALLLAGLLLALLLLMKRHTARVRARAMDQVEAMVEERLLHRQSELLRHLTGSRRVAVMVVDGQGRVREASHAALALVGQDREALEQERLRWDVIAPPAWTRMDRTTIAQRMDRGDAPDQDDSLLRQDGTRVPVRIDALPLDGDRFLVLAIDLTWTRQVEAELGQKTIELERYKVIFDSTPVSIFAKEYRGTEPGVYILANPMCQEVLGVDRLVDRSDYEIFPPDVAAAVQANDRQVVDNGVPVVVEEWAPDARTGNLLYFISTKVPLRDATGTPYGIGGIALDITRQQQLTERLAALVDAIPDSLIRLDDEGRILDFESNHDGPLAGSREGLIGASVNEAPLPRETRQQIMEAIRRVRATAQLQEVEYSLVTPAGERHHEARLVASGSNEVVVLVRDITEAKRTRAELQATNARLQAVNDELKEFAYVASHDLQEPLRTVHSFVELLESRYGDAFDEKGRKWLQFIVSGTQRMHALIDDLLAYSRVGRISRFASIDTRALVDMVLDDMRAGIAAAGAEIHVGDLPRVTANATDLRQVFQNLISNALKFRRPEVTARVTITAEPVAHGWAFTVADNGIGIEPEFHDRIFLVFQRLHSRDRYPGTGIGLALVKKIIERQGGQVTVRSTPGEGSAFRFTIPAMGVDAPVQGRPAAAQLTEG